LITASMVSSSVVVVAYWLCRPQRWNQLSLFEWFAATSVIAAMVGIYVNEEAIYVGLREPGRRPLHDMPAYALVGLWLGISCTLVATGRLISQFVAQAVDPQSQVVPPNRRR